MDRNRNLVGLAIGVTLIALGILSLFGQFFTFINWDNLWPLIIIGIGLVFFVWMVLGGKTYGGLAVPGSILTVVGLILLVMNSTDQWAAWSYAWALIFCGIGAGILINGVWSDRPDLRKSGLEMLRAGFILFLIFGILMQFIFSFTGVTGGNLFLWAALLVLMGLFLLITRLFRVGMAEGEHADLFWPILMIGGGVITILAYLNWLPMENLWLVLNLWPVLLIVAGLSLLFRRSAWIGAILGVLVVALIFVAGFSGKQLGLKANYAWPFTPGAIQFGNVSGENVIGSGNVITQDRPVSGFDRMSLEIPANLDIQQGAAEKLTISAEDNLLPYLTTDVSFGELVIRFKPTSIMKINKPIQITLTVKNLKELQNSSSGNVTVKPITTGNFQISLSSSGNVQMEGIQADTIKASLSSSGDVTIKGSANVLDVQASSSGSFNAGDLQVQSATVRLSSSGEVTVWVIKNLEASISSSGNIAYYGSPSIHQTTSSSGTLIPKGAK